MQNSLPISASIQWNVIGSAEDKGGKKLFVLFRRANIDFLFGRSKEFARVSSAARAGGHVSAGFI